MTELDEQLSMLWGGELDEASARLLRARIEAEPAVAQRWQRLCSAMSALEELPAELPPPPLRLQAQARPVLLRSPWKWATAGLAAAAAALLVALSSLPQPSVVLVDGAQWVEGELHLAAGGATIDVDGKVWISVEPAAGQERVGVPDPEEEMNKSTVMAGLAGAIVTVVVYQGTAVVRAAGEDAPTVVQAGETHRTVPSRKLPKGPVTPEVRQQHIDQLQKELADVQQALAEAQFEGALTRGQLQAMQGVPSPWPDEVPSAFSPESFRANLQARLEGLPNMEIAEVDCAEYPCVAAIHYTGEVANDEWDKPIGDAVRGWLDEVGGDDLSVRTNTSRFRTDDKDERYIIFGAHEGDRDETVGARTDYRIDAMVGDLGQRLKDEEP